MSSLAVDVVQNRFLGFLIWQSIQSTAVFLYFRVLLIALLFSDFRLLPSLHGFLFFLTFHLSLLLFSVSVSLSAAPQPCRVAFPWELALSLLRFLLVPGGTAFAADSRDRAKVSLSLVLFVAVSAVSGFLSVVSLCGLLSLRDAFSGTAGLRGLAHGLMYGLYYVFKRRWVLSYPIIQRPLFFSFKMGLSQAVQHALKLSTGAYMISAFLVVFLPDQFKSRIAVGEFIRRQIILYVGNFFVFLCWELCHHLFQVLHTKRFIFAPPKGSAAAETNPSKYLLAGLEESGPRSLLQHLAYLDLCMVCENNVDTWRRAAFFEETGETYKRVMAACLRPLMAFASNLAKGLDSCAVENGSQLPNQSRLPAGLHVEADFHESFNDFQLCVWCARAAASLTARSHDEDRFGVAQLSGCNAAVVSTLLSCLLAVEAVMGKKNSFHSSQGAMGPAGIKWAALNAGRKDTAAFGRIVGRRKVGPLHARAYAIADVLRTSVYCIVSAFYDEMASTKAGFLEKDWISSEKPVYGSRELLLQKLKTFLDFQAC